MKVVSGRGRVAHVVNEIATATVQRIIATSMVDVLYDAPRTIERMLRFQRRPVWIATRPVGIYLPVLRRGKSRWPARGIISAPTFVGPDNISGGIISGIGTLFITVIADRFVLGLRRPDSTGAECDIVPLVIRVSLPVRTVCLCQRRRGSTMSFYASVGFFQTR